MHDSKRPEPAPPSPERAPLHKRLFSAGHDLSSRVIDLLRVPPSPSTILHVVSLMIPVTLMAIGFKIHKVVLLERPMSDALPLIPADLFTVSVYSVLWTWALHLTSRGARAVVAVSFHLMTLVFMTLLAMEWNFFRTTYEVVDWYMVRYAFEQFEELRKVMLSEVPPALYVGAVALLLLNLTPVFFRFVPAIRRLRLRQYPRPLRRLHDLPLRRNALYLGSVALVGLTLGVGVSAGAALEALFTVAIVTLGAGFALTPKRDEDAREPIARMMASQCSLWGAIAVLIAVVPPLLVPLDATGPLSWQLHPELAFTSFLVGVVLTLQGQLFNRAALVRRWGAELGATLSHHHERGVARERLLVEVSAHPKADRSDADDLTPRRWMRGPHAGLWGTVAGLTLVAGALAVVEVEDEDLVLLKANPLVQVFGDALRDYYLPSDESEFSFPDAVAGPVFLNETPETKDYNVVILVLESTRARSVTPYNPEIKNTPVMDDLSRRGRLVENAYTTIPHTSKALVGINCGFYPKIDTPIEEAQAGVLPVDCLARLLKKKGYSTAFFQPAEEGYEGRNSLVKHFGYSYFKGKESLPSKGFHESSYFGYEDDIMLEPSLEWADKQTRPFLLTYLTLSAHHLYTIPHSIEEERFDDDDLMNRYLNTVRYTDRFVGKVIKGFEERGLLDKTLFVIIGDHGEGFGEHRRNQHDNVIYEEGVRIPLLLFGAGVKDVGEPIKGLRQSIDVLPTITELLGYELSGWELPGKSLVSTPGHDRVYISCWYHNRCMAIREGTHKYIYHYKRKGMEVFDLSSDPNERANLLRKETVSRETAKSYSTDMRRWKALTNAYYEQQLGLIHKRLVTHQPPSLSTPLKASFGDFARLRGIDSSAKTTHPGGEVELTLHFEAIKRPKPGWKLFTHITKPGGGFINKDHVPAQSSHPVAKWSSGEFIRDPITISIPSDAKPGLYTVLVGFWNSNKKGDDARALVKGPAGKVTKDRAVRVFTIRVKE